MTKRTFIAVKIEPENNLLKAYENIRETLSKERIKWVDSKNFHLTLKFLGDTDSEQISRITEELQHIAKKTKKNDLMIKGLGSFPNSSRPRVLWFGIENYKKLAEIAAKIDSSLINYGFPKEKYQFKPHLTIGRIKFLHSTNELKNLISNYSDTLFQNSTISEIIFYESILKKEGPVYIPIEKIKLAD